MGASGSDELSYLSDTTASARISLRRYLLDADGDEPLKVTAANAVRVIQHYEPGSIYDLFAVSIEKATKKDEQDLYTELEKEELAVEIGNWLRRLMPVPGDYTLDVPDSERRGPTGAAR